jgi:hypothetical protein
MQAKNPRKNLTQKGKTQWNTSWVGLLEVEVSTKPIVSQILIVNPINRVMSIKQIFQDISKHMLETTYTLRLGQLLKITLDFKIYMWQKLKPKKSNIVTKVILKPSVVTMVELHSKVDTVIIKIDNQTVIIQVQVGKNIVEDVLLNGGTSANIITNNLKTKLGLPKPRLVPYHLRMVD